ncbi:hypothetical protein N7474_003610 [Penicillium riverlandense]|uniref:uncharacterized protein n=1 Tax=Penicillium riverlandense TaxID=1903569 RepID=UPI002547FF07|nr:uncharacterized protein N7474_003610 [Penicillium riverlandense]KAJ5818019.1 hypothetical protein N7474_003610 [Penicillium riverlandense]
MSPHPLQALGEAAGSIGIDPRATQLSSLFQGANDGPARTAAKLTGVQVPGKRMDDGPYFTSNEVNFPTWLETLPVFFCRDPIQGPDVIRSQYRNPQNFLLDHNSLFDLLANTPEGNHAGMMFFSDHGTPVGWRHNHGYGCHTFRWVNADGKFIYIKYHFLANHGQKQFTADEATRLSGEDPDFSKRDLWRTIEKGEEIIWTAHVQIMQPEDADPEKLGFDPFDVTKIWPKAQFPAAFSPGSMVPGIEDSPDPLLQFRTFFYRDAQLHRIGVNWHQIPVNCPFIASSYASLNFDGQMRVDANHAMNPQYAPNSFVSKFRPDTAEAPYQLADNTFGRKSHFYHEGSPSEYEQPRALYEKVMTSEARGHLHSNTATMLKKVEYPVI